ncbi:hypothetical protein ACQEU6_26495 [Spirillospora sp. CA-108201]
MNGGAADAVLRETLYGPNRSGCSATDRGPRVPAPGLRWKVAVRLNLGGHGEIEAQQAPEATAWSRRAVAEYIAPAPDPVAAGVDGFRA